ncbi:MAG: hypothetical protein LBB58_05345 [Cellulomonadaceae bacterium]|jgi:hypothetical protein|nr:hypothetical protein [Cellulomonadaceae bacterium]
MFFYTGASPLFFMLFFMPFLLPAILRMLSGLATGLVGGVEVPSQVAPNTAESFDTAKREFPSKMLDLDNELTLAEEFDTDLNADELKAARSHLNNAFAAYSKNFGSADLANVNVAASRRTIERHLAAAQRHLGLADPNSPLHNEPAPAAASASGAATASTAENTARPATPEEELYRRFGVNPGEHAQTPFTAPRVQTAPRRTAVHLTPFGLMIGF